MGLVQIGCPICGGPFQVDTAHAGMQVACPHCRNAVLLGALDGPPPAPTPPASNAPRPVTSPPINVPRPVASDPAGGSSEQAPPKDFMYPPGMGPSGRGPASPPNPTRTPPASATGPRPVKVPDKVSDKLPDRARSVQPSAPPVAPTNKPPQPIPNDRFPPGMQPPSVPPVSNAPLPVAPPSAKVPQPVLKPAPKPVPVLAPKSSPTSPPNSQLKETVGDELLPTSLATPTEADKPSSPGNSPPSNDSPKSPRPVSAAPKPLRAKTGNAADDLLPSVGGGPVDPLAAADDLLPQAAGGTSNTLQAVMREVPLPTMSDNLTKKIVNPEFTMREPTTKTIKVGGQEIELRVLSPEEKARRRRRRNLIVIAMSVFFIGFLVWFIAFKN